MMWRYPPGDVDERECWWIVLPQDHPDLGTPGHPSSVSWCTTDKASEPPHQMWDVSGTPPNITVSPSIDVTRWLKRIGPDGKVESYREGSYWHGWIRNGVLEPPAATNRTDWRWIEMSNGVRLRVRR